MTRLITDSERKLFPALDKLRVHHEKLVTAWLEGRKKRNAGAPIQKLLGANDLYFA